MKKILLGILAIGLMVITGCDSSNDELKKLELQIKLKELELKEKGIDTQSASSKKSSNDFVWEDVTNPVTGRTWMDRNIGASRAATSSTDASAFGNLYQWGRGSDGHQYRKSEATNILSDTDQPGHNDFIINNNSPWDWKETQNDSLWQGVDGINNPCPTGYRLPTETEWEEEVESWTSEDHNGAYGSVLKLPMAGYRLASNGSLDNVGTRGGYWSSTVSGILANYLHFNSSNADMHSNYRAYGFSVRCLKD
jgi:uncharacterized protein (TIGR02145 family)|tara:strand:+ start:1022 stop:1777 length:756 start_codon:yes stop_codon:yes gene_type:complete